MKRDELDILDPNPARCSSSAPLQRTHPCVASFVSLCFSSKSQVSTQWCARQAVFGCDVMGKGRSVYHARQVPNARPGKLANFAMQELINYTLPKANGPGQMHSPPAQALVSRKRRQSIALLLSDFHSTSARFPSSHSAILSAQSKAPFSIIKTFFHG